MFICLTFNFVFFVGMAMHELKIFTAYFYFSYIAFNAKFQNVSSSSLLCRILLSVC